MKDLDPSTESDLNKVFSPGGDSNFIPDAPRARTDQYQERIWVATDGNFPKCLLCGDEVDQDDVSMSCSRCPRQFHQQCTYICAASIFPPSKTHMHCKYCQRDDRQIGPGEDIQSGRLTLTKYKEFQNSKNYLLFGVLCDLLQILYKLRGYTYGHIFAFPGEF